MSGDTTVALQRPAFRSAAVAGIHGESNIGKTQLVRKFIRDHPPGYDERRGVERRQIVSVQMPALPNQERFYAALLSKIGVSPSPRSSVAVLEDMARQLLHAMRPSTLVVDTVTISLRAAIGSNAPR